MSRRLTQDEVLIREMRLVVRRERDDDLCDLDFEAENRDISAKQLPYLRQHGGSLRSIRLHLTDMDIDGMPDHQVAYFVESAGFLDRWVSADAVSVYRGAGGRWSGSTVSPLPPFGEAVLSFPDALGAPATASISDIRPPATPAQRQVPSARLKAWWNRWSQKALNAGHTEADALKAAKLEFADFLVTRERVRELRGAQKRGPKPFRGKVTAK